MTPQQKAALKALQQGEVLVMPHPDYPPYISNCPKINLSRTEAEGIVASSLVVESTEHPRGFLYQAKGVKRQTRGRAK